MRVGLGTVEGVPAVASKLCELHSGVVAATALLAPTPSQRTGKDLAAVHVVHLGARTPELALVPPKKKAAVTHAYTPRITVDSAAAMPELVLAGVGIATLPEVLVRRDVPGARPRPPSARSPLAAAPVSPLWCPKNG